ncbi:MAG: NERD domain-containing protein [Gammaproteobacteria bacterium]|nr:NERD domain-containing protein [Gammaproteobacteria bacterium]MDH5776766.1 NERD domain-containing protein [Gammaproteobacteria bacterium]
MTDMQLLLKIGVPLAATVILAIALFKVLRGYFSKNNHARLIKKISKRAIRNVIIPDAVEGSSFIDWVILTPKGILVLNIKSYRGMIFASENIHQWTQVVNKRSYTFKNPLPQLELDVVTIKSFIPGAPVKGYVVFDYDSVFPKGKPAKVTTINEIKQNIQLFSEGEISEELNEYWNKLKETLKQNEKEGYSNSHRIENSV